MRHFQFEPASPPFISSFLSSELSSPYLVRLINSSWKDDEDNKTRKGKREQEEEETHHVVRPRRQNIGRSPENDELERTQQQKHWVEKHWGELRRLA